MIVYYCDYYARSHYGILYSINFNVINGRCMGMAIDIYCPEESVGCIEKLAQRSS